MPAETSALPLASLSGPLLITPQVFNDDRGFYESWNERRFRNDLIDTGTPAVEAEAIQFRQDHSDPAAEYFEAFICTRTPGQTCALQCGEIFDVAVDLRRGSLSHGQWVGAS